MPRPRSSSRARQHRRRVEQKPSWGQHERRRDKWESQGTAVTDLFKRLQVIQCLRSEALTCLITRTHTCTRTCAYMLSYRAMPLYNSGISQAFFPWNQQFKYRQQEEKTCVFFSLFIKHSEPTFRKLLCIHCLNHPCSTCTPIELAFWPASKSHRKWHHLLDQYLWKFGW